MSVVSGKAYRPFGDDLVTWDPFWDSHFTAAPFIANDWSWKETPEAHVLEAHLGGLRGDEVKVLIEGDNVLRISGEKKVVKEETTDGWFHVERSCGKFLRRFKLPGDARTDKTKARIENGMLTVTVPKTETTTNHKPGHYYQYN